MFIYGTPVLSIHLHVFTAGTESNWMIKQYLLFHVGAKEEGDIMTVFEMAKQYYPRLWDDSRIEQLVQAGRLTKEEAEEITSKTTA